MTSLIHILKNQHAELLTSMKKVNYLGVISEAGQEELRNLKRSLVAHLKIEDAELYPALKSDEAHGAMGGHYIAETEEITGRTMQFFEKYKNGGRGFEFAKDFGRLHAALSSRIRSEEGTLYLNCHLPDKWLSPE